MTWVGFTPYRSIELLAFNVSPKYASGKMPNLPEMFFNAFDKTFLIRQAGGLRVRRTTRYQGDSDLLVIYGPGAPERYAAMVAQRLQGKHTLCFDAPYWHRGTKLRISIDAPHPQHWVMRLPMNRERFEKDGQSLRDTWDPYGPVLMAGIGAKATVQYGAERVAAWERMQIDACRARWPGRQILYRPKPKPKAHPPAPAGTTLAVEGTIDDVLHGARPSLVITWHSNVAVDALLRNIPVVCYDGAARAVCPDTLPDTVRPLPPKVRAQFLWNLAYLQWAPNEFMKMMLHVENLLYPIP